MQLLLIGLNHKSAPLEVRERASFSNEDLCVALRLLRDMVGEAVILSTCNRTEIYSTSDCPERTGEQIRSFIAESRGIWTAAVSPHVYEFSDADAVCHLFRVASGLDSMIVGESQILGQVRNAFAAAS